MQFILVILFEFMKHLLTVRCVASPTQTSNTTLIYTYASLILQDYPQ